MSASAAPPDSPAPAPAQTFHRRPLPPALVAMSSAEGQRLFAEALAAGTMAGYFAVAEHFQTQAEPAFCGLTSLTIGLNSLGIDPGRAWKGPWRWFDETMLDCCVGLDEVRAHGVTLDEVACLARCNGALAEVEHGADHDAVALRTRALAATTSAEGPRLLVAYARAGLGQTGDGHFSPVAGYHAGRDLVLVLDVARFKYPPHWVALTDLHAATLPVDAATGRSRGWITLTRAAVAPAFALAVRSDRLSWKELAGLVGAGRAAVAAAAARAEAAALDPARALAEVTQAWLQAVHTIGAAIGFRPLVAPALVSVREELAAELVASLAGVMTAPQARALALEPALATLLVLAPPTPVLEAAGSVGPAWRALRADLSPTLREQLELLDTQLAEVLRAGACCRR